MSLSTPTLAIDQLVLRYNGTTALNGVYLAVSAKEIVCLLGQSGCGKSSLLRAISGVERPTSGTIEINGSLVASPQAFVEPEHRHIGFMVQDYALFPHLTARANIAFGLRNMPRSEVKARTQTIIERLGIAHLSERYPHQLSGGEQQRVALARALAPQPHILLMDEPFSNLDRSLRDDLRAEVVALLRALGTTAIIVTHDPEEALTIGDRVVLMRDGKIVEDGPGNTLFNAPQTAYAAEFFSAINRIPAQRSDDRLVTALGTFPAPAGSTATTEVHIRPRAIQFTNDGITATVLAHRVLGEVEEWRLSVPGLAEPVIARCTQRHNFPLSSTVRISVSHEDVLAF